MNMSGKLFRLCAFGALAFFALAIGAYALLFYGSPEGLREQLFVTEKGAMPAIWYGILWAHAVSAGIALAIGWLQFVKRLRLKAPWLHRAIGYIYSAAIAIGGLTGLYLAFYSNGGWSARIGFSVLSILWLFTLYRSLESIIVNRDAAKHGRWMTYNYALSCAAISLRIYTTLAAVILGISDTNVSFVVIAWLAWIPNLLIARYIMSKRSNKIPFNNQTKGVIS
ncbi:DUF2306 domain-containing protein [Paenibacillus radicis (ex Gao et al. 2016)]|uniref:DUF2306 domain-containing protein n=1 Tax=Paenibacillus radicis (ex Gao et al. 2016) TaxID=1737354 RepID=A0A917H4S0_9BACL|nr:DUF2306 domain-containing protein [Paenibacillus radicis (ex Gao et al. 2016)]GGG66690.1 hypothetical protein GCM10010918_21460 [Paenibacillus radicis (ex Gao et al. 2016)]